MGSSLVGGSLEGLSFSGQGLRFSGRPAASNPFNFG